MEHDRSAKINIGGREFELILTTRATKEITIWWSGKSGSEAHAVRKL